MALPSADRAWLLRFAERIRTALMSAPGPVGLTVAPRSEQNIGESDTRGWWIELGALQATPSVKLELWLDRYADSGSRRRLWYGIGAHSSKSIERVVVGLDGRFSPSLRITDADLSDDARWTALSDPLTREQYEAPILSIHGVSGYGFYEWHVPPFSSGLERDRAEHVATFFRQVGEHALALGPSGGRRTRRRSMAAVLRAIEDEGMARAMEFYRKRGYTPKDVHLQQSYDIRCMKGDEVRYIEVKSTTSDGTKVTLTANEVHLSNTLENFDLFVLHSLRTSVAKDGGRVRVSGGEHRVFHRWHPEPADLRPVEYEVSLRRASSRRQPPLRPPRAPG